MMERGYGPHRESGLGKGSISVFLVLTLTLILSFVFSILELARVQGMEKLAERNLTIRLESAFGEYLRPMWDDYGMLFLDAGYGTGELDIEAVAEHIMEEAYLNEQETGFYSMALSEIKINEYALATDYEGAAFQNQACTVIKEQIKSEAVDNIREILNRGDEMTKESNGLDAQWKNAQKAVQEAEHSQQQTAEGLSLNNQRTEDDLKEKVKKEEELPENPMDYVKSLKESTLLSMVLEDPSKLSGKAVNLSNNLENRKLNTGNKEELQQVFADRVWFLQYLNYYFSCGTGKGQKGSSQHALNYELEYCLGGKSTDRENLEIAVKAILAIREVGNFATLMQDSGKKEIALGIAAAAVGFTGMPPLIKAVQIGILLAWSYVESILDVRCLLSGGKVALVKKITEWKSDISDIKNTTELQQEEQQQQDQKGLDYRSYLQIVLFITKEKVLTDRAMDVMEKNLQMYPESREIQMDHMVQDIQAQAVFTGEPLFLNLITISKPGFGTYYFKKNSEISYYKK